MLKDIDTSRDYITTAEAARRSGLSTVYLTQLLRKGTLEGVQVVREWLIYTDSLEKFLATPRKSGPKGPRKKGLQEPSEHLSLPERAVLAGASYPYRAFALIICLQREGHMPFPFVQVPQSCAGKSAFLPLGLSIVGEKASHLHKDAYSPCTSCTLWLILEARAQGILV